MRRKEFLRLIKSIGRVLARFVLFLSFWIAEPTQEPQADSQPVVRPIATVLIHFPPAATAAQFSVPCEEPETISEEAIKERAAQLLEMDRMGIAEDDQFRNLVSCFCEDETRRHLKLIHLERYEDSASIPGFDVLADSIERECPYLVRRGENFTDTLFRILKTPRRKALLKREAIEQARELLEAERAAAADMDFPFGFNAA